MSHKLHNAITEAIEQCQRLDEEEGGILVMHEDTDDIRFVKLKNANTGTPTALSLYTADIYEYARQIVPMFSKGWKSYATFHTHPRWDPIPSSVDETVLFKCMPMHVIYSHKTKTYKVYKVHEHN